MSLDCDAGRKQETSAQAYQSLYPDQDTGKAQANMKNWACTRTFPLLIPGFHDFTIAYDTVMSP